MVLNHEEREMLRQSPGLDGYVRALESRNELLAERVQELEISAYTDPVTGLWNRRFFDKHLPVELDRAKRHGYPLTLLIVDLDRFKEINDSLGHPGGDEVLRDVSRAIMGNFRARSGDITCRYGGEEYAIILPFTGYEAGLAVAERLRRALHVENVQASPGDAKKISVTVSIGLATYPGGSIENPQQLVKMADSALYGAKERGRNRVCTLYEIQDSPNSP